MGMIDHIYQSGCLDAPSLTEDKELKRKPDENSSRNMMNAAPHSPSCMAKQSSSTAFAAVELWPLKCLCHEKGTCNYRTCVL